MYLDEDPGILIQHLIPPPELHLLIGVVSHIGSMLLDLWSVFDDWLVSKHILQRGYQERGWDGNNYNTILNQLDSLEVEILENAQHLMLFIQCLKLSLYEKHLSIT